MGQPTPGELHVDHMLGEETGNRRRRRRKRKEDEVAKEELMGLLKRDGAEALEAMVYKRDFSAAERRKLASEGKALSDGSYPMPDADAVRRAAILARSGHGNVSGAKSLIGRRAKALGIKNPLSTSESKTTSKADDGADVVIEVPIWKGEREGKVYGVVLAPDREDSQGDVLSAGEIEKACHRFMVESRKADVQHSGEVTNADLIENYIAPSDFTVEMADGTTETVTKGSWLQAWQVNDPVVKQEIEEGKRTGFSIFGKGVRTEIPA